MTASNTTVDDENPVVQYTATSGQTIFDTPWLFFEDSDLTAYLTPTGNDADDTADLLTLTTDYTVTNTDTETGGTIVLNSGATTNDIITIYRVMTLERQTDYQASGDLLTETLNKEQDTAMMILQQLRESVSRALGFKRTETSSASLQIPSPLAGYVLAWNSGATALENKLWHDASDVATNTANIATNTANIATNTTGIATNVTNIALKYNKTGGVLTGPVSVSYGSSPAITLEPVSSGGHIALHMNDSTSIKRLALESEETTGLVTLSRYDSVGSLEAQLYLSSTGNAGVLNGTTPTSNSHLAPKDYVDGKFSAGVTGTYPNPTSITVVNGLITAIS